MNDDAREIATNQTISLNNEPSPYAVVSDRSAPNPNAAAAAFTLLTDADGGGGVNVMGFEFDNKNPLLLSLRPGGRGQEETRRKGSLGR